MFDREVRATIAAAAIAAGLAAPAAGQDKLDFKTVPAVECRLSHVHMCGAAEKCESGPGQHVMRFDLEKDTVCTMAGASGPCEKEAKFEAYESEMLSGIVVYVKSNRSMFHISPEGGLTGSQMAAGVMINMMGACRSAK